MAVTAGDTIVTVGDEITPPNIAVGIIKDVTDNPLSPYKDVSVSVLATKTGKRDLCFAMAVKNIIFYGLGTLLLCFMQGSFLPYALPPWATGPNIILIFTILLAAKERVNLGFFVLSGLIASIFVSFFANNYNTALFCDRCNCFWHNGFNKK